jgi:hypothetical protein
MGGDNSYLFADSCNFKYNTAYGYGGGSLAMGVFDHCDFSNNNIGVGGYEYYTINNSTIDSNEIGIKNPYGSNLNNCKIRHNQIGIISSGANVISGCEIDFNSVEGIETKNQDSLINCKIRFNNLGIADFGWNHGSIITKSEIENNTTGIHLEGIFDKIYCNKICNNTTYDLYYNLTQTFNAANNYWCSNDSATIRSHIYDGYVNITLGLVYITPFDTIGCYLNTDVPFIAEENSTFTIYPNPTINNFSLKDISLSKTSLLQIINSIGEVVYKEILFGRSEYIINANLSAGIYFVQVSNEEKNVVRKLIVE